MVNNKTAWETLASSWKRIAAVIAAVATITALICNIFPWEAGKVTATGIAIGGLVLFIGWAIDKQQEYTDSMLESHIKEYSCKMASLTDSISELKRIAEDTRKDTLRIQLSQYIQYQPDNVETILKVAETYFCGLKGDWVMTAEFMGWADAHGVKVPFAITKAIEEAESQ